MRQHLLANHQPRKERQMTDSLRLVAASLAAGCLALPAAAQQDQGYTPDPDQRPASFVDRDGNEVGAANITDGPAGGVLIGLQIEGLPANQWVAFHIHENGECNPEDGFESAGGHFNPDDSAHGYLADGGPHAGDMPNQFVPENGVLFSQVFNSMVSLDGEQPSIRGRALVFHAAPDDYESQPSGNAGDRLACAVIE
jgi:superoxide dismutase, Cu-Zn family